MNLKELRHQAFLNYKNNRGNSWVLAIICSFFIASVFLLSYFSSILLIVLVPLICLPFLFACTVAHRGLIYNNGNLKYADLRRFFGLYFHPPFSSTYRVMRTILFALLTEIATQLIFGLILYFIFRYNIPEFNDEFALLTNALSSGDYQSANDILNSGYYLVIFMNINTCVAFFASYLYVIHAISRNNFSINFRLDFGRANPNLLALSYRNAIKANHGEFNKAFYYLNWPLYVLFILGVVTGSLLSYFFISNKSFVIPLGGAGGILFISIFLPFYFSNNEVLYNSMKLDFSKATVSTAEEVALRIKANEQLNEQQLNQINDILNKIKDNNQDAEKSDQNDSNES